MEQLRLQGQYHYQKKSPLPLQNVTSSYQNANRQKENDESVLSSSSANLTQSSKNKPKLDQSSNSSKNNQIVSSEEIVSKYYVYLQSTKSAGRSSGSATSKRGININVETTQDGSTTSQIEFNKTSPLSLTINSKSPARSLLGEIGKIERTKSEDKISSQKNTMSSSKSTALFGLTQQQDFKIDHENNNSTNEFKLQLIRKLGELEIELKKESIKNQNLEYDNKNLRTTIHKLQEQFKSQSKDNLDLRKTIDSLNKEIAEYIKMHQEYY